MFVNLIELPIDVQSHIKVAPLLIQRGFDIFFVEWMFPQYSFHDLVLLSSKIDLSLIMKNEDASEILDFIENCKIFHR